MANPEQYGEYTPILHNDLLAGARMLSRLPAVKGILALANRVEDGNGEDSSIHYSVTTERDFRRFMIQKTARDNPFSHISTAIQTSRICDEPVGQLHVVRYRCQSGKTDRLIGNYDSANPHRNELPSVLVYSNLLHILLLQRNRATTRVAFRRVTPQ